MTIKSTLSIAALVSGFAFAGAAYAQTTIGGLEYSAEDQTVVQAYCDDLALDALNEGSLSQDKADEVITNPTEPNYTAASIDLSAVTLEDCREAGLVE